MDIIKKAFRAIDNFSGWKSIVNLVIFVQFLGSCLQTRDQDQELVEAMASGDISAESSQLLVILYYVDLGTLAIFTLELLIKFLAYGPLGYFNDSSETSASCNTRFWRVLNFFIWLEGALYFLLSRTNYLFVPFRMPNFMFLRATEFLFPLGSLDAFVSGKEIGRTIMLSVSPIMSVFALVLFGFLLFGVMGVNLFGVGGGYRSRCVFDEKKMDPEAYASLVETDPLYIWNKVKVSRPEKICRVWNTTVGNITQLDSNCRAFDKIKNEFVNNSITKCWVATGLPDDLNPAIVYPAGRNPSTTVSFDDFFKAVLVVLTVFFQDGWVEMMEKSMEVAGGIPIAYFCVLMVIGAFYLLNMTVAISSLKFSEVRAAVRDELAANRENALLAKNDESIFGKIKNLLPCFGKKKEEKTKEVPNDGVKRRLQNLRKPVFGRVRKVAEFIEFPRQNFGEAGHEMVSYFDYGFMFVIILNTLVLCMKQPTFEDQETSFQLVLRYSRIGFVFLAVLEIIIRMLGNGFFKFWTLDNKLDLICILVSVIASMSKDLAPYQLCYKPSLDIPNMMVFRLFRLGPIFAKLPRRESIEYSINKTFYNTMGLIFAVFFTLWFVLLSALCGKEIFKMGKPERPFVSEDMAGTLPAFILLIQILFGEGWKAQLEEADGALPGTGIGPIFFVVYFVFATYLFLKIFVAIILNNFELEDRTKISMQLVITNRYGRFKNWSVTEQMRFCRKGEDTDLQTLETDPGFVDREKDMNRIRGTRFDNQDPDQIENNKPKNIVRRLCYNLLMKEPAKHYFEFLVLLLVIASSVLAVIDTPETLEINQFGEVFQPEETPEEQAHDATMVSIDQFFLGAFLLEMMLKILGWGAFGQMGYFTNSWNLLDFVIVVFMVVDTSTDYAIQALGAFRALRMLRLIRPLKDLDVKSPIMKKLKFTKNCMSDLMDALEASMGEVANVLIILIVFMFTFAVVGLNLFSGLMSYCQDEFGGTKTLYRNCTGIYQASIYSTKVFQTINGTQDEDTRVIETPGYLVWVPRRWTPPDASFDTIGDAFFTLFRMLNRAGLKDAMNAGGAITGIGLPPKVDSKPAMHIYFIIFMFFGGVFVSQIVIGSIIKNLRWTAGEALWTESQRRWNRTKTLLGEALGTFKKIGNKIPTEVPHPSTLRGRAHAICEKKFFEPLSFTVILVNTVTMCMEHYNQNNTFEIFLAVCNNIFLVWYIGEMLLKMLALGLLSYLKDPAQCFDMIIVLLSVLEQWILTNVKAGLAVFRVLRIARVFRLVRSLETMNAMLNAIISSLAEIGVALFLLVLYIFMFSSMGVQFFATVQPGVGINQYANFNNIGSAMLLMFRVAAGDDWNVMLKEAGISEPYCRANQCGNPVAAFIFFIVFVLGVNYVLLPLFVASVVHNFMKATDKAQSYVQNRDVELYVQLWKKFVPKNGGKMPLFKLRPFVEGLKEAGCVLGFKKAKDPARFERIEKELSKVIQVESAKAGHDEEEEQGFKLDICLQLLTAHLRPPTEMASGDFITVKKAREELVRRAKEQYAKNKKLKKKDGEEETEEATV